MNRYEIIANKSIEEDIMEVVEKNVTDSRYTKILDIHGRGSNGSRFGDAVWPELNFMIILYCDEEDGKNVTNGLRKVKEEFPDEGLKIFHSKVEELL